MKKEYKAVFLSPHFDDAVLSCGGTIAELTHPGPVLVVTLFGGGFDKRKKVKQRVEEEKRAAGILGFEIEMMDFEDAIYRSPRYYLSFFLHGKLSPKEDKTLQDLKKAIQTLSQKIETPVYYTPLGVGRHVDHQLTHLATIQSLPPDKIIFYEEAPYCFRSKTSGHLFAAKNFVTSVEETLFAKKISGIRSYASQKRVIGGKMAPYQTERFWKYEK